MDRPAAASHCRVRGLPLDALTDTAPIMWPRGSEDAIGQTAEFLVWAALTAQSGGGLHIFLPMLDRGIDAVAHRRVDGD